MSSRIFKSILLVAMTTLFFSFLIVNAYMFNYFSNVEKNQLIDELSVVAKGTDIMGKEFLQDINSKSYRITWINSDGDVLFDNKVDSTTMENHKDRKEIKEALNTGRGSSYRYSTTLTEKTIYEAIKLNNGTILRISTSNATIWTMMMGMLQPIIWIGLIAIILSAILGKRISNKIIEPLNKINLDEPLENNTYEELSPFLRRIDLQQREIRQQLNILRQKRIEFDKITGSMKEGLILTDDTGKIITINEAAKNLYHTDNSCIGENLITLDRQLDLRNSINSVNINGHSEFKTNIEGREYQFDLSSIVSNENKIGIVILIFDITEQFLAESNRKEFTANVSHELKTPLQGIIGYTDLIKNGIAKKEDIPRFISHIHKEATRLVVLIDDIIRLSQLDEGISMEIEKIDLYKITEEVCESLYDSAKEKNIEISFEGSSCFLYGVSRLLYEIIYNLCDNAIKYNKENGNVFVKLFQDKKNTILEVSDTGIGISPEHKDRIFERFYRIDKSHSKQSGGTGLGLSIVKHAVAYHKGKIYLESTVNKGTKIRVVFPKEEF